MSENSDEMKNILQQLLKTVESMNLKEETYLKTVKLLKIMFIKPDSSDEENSSDEE